MKRRFQSMEALQLVKQEQFNGVTCDFYNRNNQLYMTRNQIGAALEYDDPRKMIAKIHERHKERLDKFSGVVSLGDFSGLAFHLRSAFSFHNSA